MPLPGDRDRNFLVRTKEAHWVLKVAPREATRAEILLETEALAWVAAKAPELPVPRLLPTREGEVVTTLVDGGGMTHQARIVGHLPGRVLAEVRPRVPDLLKDWGRSLARLDRALEGFVPTARRRTDFEWDPRNAGRVMRNGLSALAGDRVGRLSQVLELFERAAEPKLSSLPHTVVHGDANDYNVLVAEPEAEPPGPPRRVSGLIDFGDVLEAPRVTEPAVAAAYALLDQPDPVGAAAWLVSGYHSVLPLLEDELDVLWALVVARLGVSVSMSALRTSGASDDPYLRVSEGPAWAALDQLAEVHPHFATSVLRARCGLEPSVAGQRLGEWLASQPPRGAPLLTPKVMEQPLVLDLSAGSLDLPELDTLDDPTRFNRHLTRLLADAGATVGIGRYGEPRLLYRSAGFRHPSGNPLLARTVHLGVDLFATAGTPVSAPLAGRVRSAVENAGLGDYGPTVILEHRPADGPVFWTLYGHLARRSLKRLTIGLEIEEGKAFAHLGDVLENGGWPPHVHFQLIADLLDREGEYPGVAPPDERDAWRSLSPDPALLVKLPSGSAVPSQPTTDQLADRRYNVLGRNLSVSYRRPLHVVRGWQQHLFDSSGRPYLDCVNNVAHVGHSHPRVVEAAARQKGVLETNTRYLHELILGYAERLVSSLPEPLRVCWLVNSGSEANELALRIARAAAGREDVIVLDQAYHGNTTTLVDVSPYKHAGPGGHGAPPWVHVAPLPDDYRGPYRRGEPACGQRYAARFEAAVHAARIRSGGPAAFLHESLPSCAGQLELPPGYLAEVYRMVRGAGGLVIADEIQVGLGRVGSHFWGFETQDVVPDLVTLGKPLGNGHPLGAVVATAEVARAFEATGMEYFSSLGGNPASAAVGLAVLEVIEEEEFQAHAAGVGTRLLAGLKDLRAAHPSVGDVRGRGLFLGVEMVRDPEARTPDAAVADYLVQRAREQGALLSRDGPDHNVLKIKPPLPFTDADSERLVALLDTLLAEDFVRRRS